MFPSNKSGEKPTQICGITPRTKAPKTSTKIAQKELRKSNKRNSGIERLAQDLEEEITMNILSNRLQATPRNQI
jgi:hypothetical protein